MVTITDKYHDQDLRHEINAQLDDLEAHDQPWRPTLIAISICTDHDGGLSHDPGVAVHTAFWEFCGYTNTRKIVTDCINRRSDQRESRQPFLPYDGFEREHLQDRYVVTRDGEDVGVPTRDLTDDEIDSKIGLYESQGRAAFAHAAELFRYREYRRARLDAPPQAHA